MSSHLPTLPPSSRPETLGLEPNIGALLSYLIMVPPIMPLIVLFFEREDRYVRFHALQSALFGAASFVVLIALQLIGTALGEVFRPLGFVFNTLVILLGLGVFGLWLTFLYKAYRGESFKVPVLGDEAARRA
jgi:uncharacterized membrane protein